MGTLNTISQIQIIDVDKQSFFELSEKYGDVLSLRRILSLLRSSKNCKSIVILESTLDIENEYKCIGTNGISRRCVSCYEYIDDLQKYISAYTLIKKHCIKMLFFKEKVIDKNELTRQEFKNEVVGYALVHLDKLRLEFDDAKNLVTRGYVPECVLGGLGRDIRGYKYGTFNCQVSLKVENKDVKFEIASGNYFSQQNGITNCCAHASIKTTLRGYNENISCSAINKSLLKNLNVNENEIGRYIRRFACGLSPKEILAAIADLSTEGDADNIKQLAPFLVTAHDLPISGFVETIYRAIESKIPVILLLRIPKTIDVGSSFRGHTISIIGHTFNRHNWCAYGSGYFSSLNKESYLSSYLWCENYVVQDDNFGPMYQLPSNFLADYYDYGVTMEKMGLTIASQKELSSSISHYPLSAIIIPPAEIENIDINIYHIENIAVERFVHQIQHFARVGKFKTIRRQHAGFDRYFYYVFLHQFDKPRFYIARTFLLSKEEYLESESGNIYLDTRINDQGDSLFDVVKESLPEYFWITEISVPELYWINEAKIGEIVIDADHSPSTRCIPSLIRVPHFMALYVDDSSVLTFEIENQKESYHAIIKKKKGLIRKSSHGNKHQ